MGRRCHSLEPLRGDVDFSIYRRFYRNDSINLRDPSARSADRYLETRSRLDGHRAGPNEKRCRALSVDPQAEAVGVVVYDAGIHRAARLDDHGNGLDDRGLLFVQVEFRSDSAPIDCSDKRVRDRSASGVKRVNLVEATIARPTVIAGIRSYDPLLPPEPGLGEAPRTSSGSSAMPGNGG